MEEKEYEAKEPELAFSTTEVYTFEILALKSLEQSFLKILFKK